MAKKWVFKHNTEAGVNFVLTKTKQIKVKFEKLASNITFECSI